MAMRYFKSPTGEMFGYDESDAAQAKIIAEKATDAGWRDVTASWPPAPSKAQLVAYADAKRQSIAAGGITVNVGTAANPIECLVSTDAAGIADLQLLLAQASATGQTTWYQSNGNLTVTTAQIQAIQSAVATFVASVYRAYSAVAAEISAATITTTAQIDAASWPSNS